MQTTDQLPLPAETDAKSTFILSLVLLLFLQMTGVWIENIYRLSLIKLSMGPELLGILLLFVPLMLFLVPVRMHHRVPYLLLGFVIGFRPTMSIMNAHERILIGGLLAGSLLTAVCFFLARREGQQRADLAAAGGVALVLAAGLRAWGSSLDISLGESMNPVEIFVLFALLWTVLPRCSFGASASLRDDSEAAPDRSWSAILLLFACLSLFHLALSSPSVVSAWSESNYLVNLALLTLAWAAVVGLGAGYAPGKLVLVLWNAAFLAALVGGILQQRVEFPADSAAPAVWVGAKGFGRQAALYLMFALSPVLYFNFRLVQHNITTDRPRRLILPVVAGMGFLVLVTLLLIFSNTWGYVDPVGPYLRNKFHLPFALVALGIFSSLLRLQAPAQPLCMPGWRYMRFVPAALALLAIGGAGWCARVTAAPHDGEKQLTVLTYNIQQGSALDGDQNYRKQLEFIRSVNPDLIGLQESDTPRPSGGNVDVTRYFAEALGYYFYYGPSTVAGTFGASILSRFPIENPRSFYTYSTVDEVGTAVVEFEAAGRRIAFFNSHPAGPDEVMHAHVDALIEAVKQYDHVIAVGDYNFRSDEPFYAKLSEVLHNAWTGLYPDAIGPRHPELDRETDPLDMSKRIDHIFVSDSFDVIEAWYLPAPASQTDHPAHWANLRWLE